MQEKPGGIGTPKKRKACERCGDPFVVTHPLKRFCSERCQRAAERERYRKRHTEEATCKGCGARFKRAVTGKRLRVYCSTSCQYRSRSAEYAERPDILAGMARARAARRQGSPAGPVADRPVGRSDSVRIPKGGEAVAGA